MAFWRWPLSPPGGEVTSSDVDPERPQPDEPEKLTQQGEKVVELQRKVDQLERAVESHATIDQAIGIVVAMGRLTPEQGWTVLRETSQHTNMKLTRVADLIVAWGCAGDLPEEIRRELDASLSRAQEVSECSEPSA
ncbi:ANTAR domain-containing protein [Streptomyces sp. BG9H]|uniref:ANTAR domain-containing protein n=1 Tax=Streptomyces anatolicus TaxID=2675858 RepID=A0ABS6YTD9_9ACTN|nr:ANTAR domain-containing protein [Streptomyces anatolicus]